MISAINRWVWEGSFEPRLERLSVVSPGELPEDDLQQAASRTMHDLMEMVENLQEALRRKHARGGRGIPGESGEDEARSIARGLLPSLDALDRIVEYGENTESDDEIFLNWLRSVEALRTRLMKTLEGIGLSKISAKGTEVDLEVHDVVAVVPAGEYPLNTVVAEQQKGFYFRGKLLRDAKVVVAQ